MPNNARLLVAMTFLVSSTCAFAIGCYGRGEQTNPVWSSSIDVGQRHFEITYSIYVVGEVCDTGWRGGVAPRPVCVATAETRWFIRTVEERDANGMTSTVPQMRTKKKVPVAPPLKVQGECLPMATTMTKQFFDKQTGDAKQWRSDIKEDGDILIKQLKAQGVANPPDIKLPD